MTPSPKSSILRLAGRSGKSERSQLAMIVLEGITAGVPGLAEFLSVADKAGCPLVLSFLGFFGLGAGDVAAALHCSGFQPKVQRIGSLCGICFGWRDVDEGEDVALG